MPQHPCTPVDIQNRLDAWFTPASPENLPRFVVVADIGQGNLNAIFNEHGQVFLYYDFGGGWRANLHTYPEPNPEFCTQIANHPRFILSNWDGDHIKSAHARMAGGFLNGLEWLVPTFEATSRTYKCREGLKPPAQSLRTAASAMGVGEVYKWPDDRIDGVGNVRSVTSSHFTVIRSFGGDGNNAGLVLRIQDPSAVARYMLLPGDAAYEAGALPQAFHGCDQACVALVASHHGAEIHTENDIPRPLPDIAPAIAFSFGWGNGYGHPISAGVRGQAQILQLGIESYGNRGWNDDYRADTAGSEAAARLAGPRGNVGFIWPNARPGPGCVYGPATPEGANEAAVHLIASTAAEVEYYQAGLAEGPNIAVATAYQAAVETGSRAANATHGALLVAQAMGAPHLPPGALVAPALLAVAQGIDAAVAGELTAALGVAGVAAGQASQALLQALALAISNAVMTAAAKAQVEITAVAGVGINDTDNANSIGSRAARLGFAKAVDPATFIPDPVTRGAIEAEITNVLADAVVLAALNINGINVPTRAAIKQGIAELVLAVARYAMGNPANPRTGAVSQTAKQPPAAAEAALAWMTQAIRPDVLVGLAAAAGVMPGIPINPQAAAPPWPVALNAYSLELARTAAIGAMVGYHTNNAANAGHLVRAAVAGARVGLAAAGGAPQVNCHRHPKGPNPANRCAGFCSLSIHYLMQEAEFLQVTALAPPHATVNGAQLTLTVAGANFRNGAVVRWGGVNLATVFVGWNQLTATVPAVNLNLVADIAIDVQNPAGQLSNPVLFKVRAEPPTLAGFSQPSAVVSPNGLMIAVNGTHFHANAAVRWTGVAQGTFFVSANQLTMAIPAGHLNAVANIVIDVENPDGQVSNQMVFRVLAEPPAIGVLSHVAAVVNSAGFTITVNGNQFQPNAEVLFANVPLASRQLSVNQVEGDIPANMLTVIGQFAVTVRNPDLQVSAAAQFNVRAPAPQILNLNPDHARVRGGPVNLTINGANFHANATVWGNAGQVPNAVYVHAGQLTVLIPGAAVNIVGTVQVTVTNPDGQVSNPSPFDITPYAKHERDDDDGHDVKRTKF